jgi:choline dehydrogenase-like flavoprotein
VKAAVYSRQFKGLGDVFKNAAACSKYLAPLMWRYVWDHRIFVPSASKISLLVQAEQGPVAESRIRLDPSVTDGFGLPRVVLDWRLSGLEQASIAEFARRADDALRGADLASLTIDPDLKAMNPKFISTMRDTYHQAGGTVMGTSEWDGVVDRNLKVFGTTNLYVGGASTFRTVSNANTTFTALTFTTRLIYHLCNEHPPN